MMRGYPLSLGALMLAIFVAAPVLRASTINGTTMGGTKSLFGVDDLNTVSAINVSYQTSCYWLLYGMQAQFPNVNVTFAGNGSNIGNLFTPISASDFTISQYAPWVVNNWVTTDANGKVTGGMNYVTSPAVANSNNLTFARGVQGQDSGGVNIVISYKPQAGSNDPTKVNFLQSSVSNFNNSNPNFMTGTGGIDNLGSSKPFYNVLGFAGSGTTYDGITLTASPTSAAWLADIPYVCEGVIPTPMLTIPLANANCTGGVDDSLITATEIFQTFVESNQTLYYNPNITNGNPYSLTDNGGMQQTWDVLYGGVQWGFTYTSTDTPEPFTLLLLGISLLGLAGAARRRLFSSDGGRS